MKTYIKVFGCSIFIIIVILSVKFGGQIPFKDQLPIYDGLRNTSAIIFAVMGAWISILYPNKLSAAFSKAANPNKKAEIEDIKRLFKPMIYSTIILMIVICMSFIVPLAKQITFLLTYKETFRAISFTIITTLSIIQLWSLILTLLPGDSIKDDLDKQQARDELINRMRSPRNRN